MPDRAKEEPVREVEDGLTTPGRAVGRWQAAVGRWARMVAAHFHHLQWLHSLWALLVGVGVMYFARQDFRYFRLLVGYLVAIWLASLLLNWEAERFGLTERRHPKVRRVVLYCIQNFYHEMLFFLLPLYYLSTTFSSRNLLFFLLVVGCALVASFDVVYWQWLTRGDRLAQGFYAVALFSCFNAFVPVLTGIRNSYSVFVAGGLACLGFVTLSGPPREWLTLRTALRFGMSLAVSLGLVFLLRSFVPPCPMYLLKADFGVSFNRRTLQLDGKVRTSADLGGAEQLYVLAAVKAPMGLYERVSIVWYRDGDRISQGRAVEFSGGREQGFRLWSSVSVAGLDPSHYRVDITTEGGQLVGRANLPVR